MTQTIITALIGAGIAVGVGILLYFLFLLIKGKFNKGNRKNAEKDLMNSKIEALTDIVISNQNTLQVPETSRKAIAYLVAIRTDKKSELEIEAQKAKASKVALKDKQIKKTKKVKMY